MAMGGALPLPRPLCGLVRQAPHKCQVGGPGSSPLNLHLVRFQAFVLMEGVGARDTADNFSI